MEQRNDMRVWTDHLHKVFTVFITMAVGWIVLTTHNNDKATDVILSKIETFQHVILAVQTRQDRYENRLNQLESYLPRIDERTKYIQKTSEKITEDIKHLTNNQHEFMPIVYEAQRFMREQSK